MLLCPGLQNATGCNITTLKGGVPIVINVPFIGASGSGRDR
ncbi:MAG: hypothetical protein ACKODX_03690 [Gemmata sp.]